MPHARVSATTAALAATAALLAACGSSGPDTNTTIPPNGGGTPAVQQPTAAGLPFHYAFGGESASPAFHVSTAGTYTVAYTLKGDAQTPGCSMTIGLVSLDGASVNVLKPTTLQPTDTKTGSTQVTLSVSDWHFQEGGGCSWDVTVSQGS